MIPVVRNLALGVAASAAATYAKTKAEQLLQPAAENAFPPAPASRVGIGADAAGHPENMPPSELADRVQHVVTGDQLTDHQREQVSAPLHWAMGVGFGTAYALVSTKIPQVRVGFGTAAAAILFGATHLTGLPATGMQQRPAEMPAAWWVWEGGSHLVYGATLDLALRLLDGVTTTAGKR